MDFDSIPNMVSDHPEFLAHLEEYGELIRHDFPEIEGTELFLWQSIVHAFRSGNYWLASVGCGPFLEAIMRSVVFKFENDGSAAISPKDIPLIESIRGDYQLKKLLKRLTEYIDFDDADLRAVEYLTNTWRELRNSVQHGDIHRWPVIGDPVVNSVNAPALSPIFFGFATAINSPVVLGSARNLASWLIGLESRLPPKT